MSEPLTFAMGEFAAEIPTDRQYAKNHMWARQEGERWKFGFSAYAVRLLQDVYFLDWTVDASTTLTERQEIGAIESKKAESDLYSPATGKLEKLNDALMRDPSTINVDKYEGGWLFEMTEVNSTPFLTPEEYINHLADVWEVTQRMIKGQLNQ